MQREEKWRYLCEKENHDTCQLETNLEGGGMVRKMGGKLGGKKARDLTHSPEFLGSLEAFVVRDGEDAEETLAAAKIIVSDGGVVLLAGRVQYIYLYFFAIQHNLWGLNGEF